MVVLPECPSAQPGPGVRQEHVLEVLVCQHEHLHPLAPGWGWSPSYSGGWHKLAPGVQIQPLCIVETLLSLLAKRRAQGNGKLLGALVYLCVIVHLKTSSECSIK